MKSLFRKYGRVVLATLLVMFPALLQAQTWGTDQDSLTIYALLTGVVLLLVGIVTAVLVLYVAIAVMRKRNQSYSAQ